MFAVFSVDLLTLCHPSTVFSSFSSFSSFCAALTTGFVIFNLIKINLHTNHIQNAAGSSNRVLYGCHRVNNAREALNKQRMEMDFFVLVNFNEILTLN